MVPRSCHRLFPADRGKLTHELLGVLVWLGLAALGVIRDPFAQRPAARVVTLGALVGGFLIGRPYPLFNKLFH